MTLPRESDRPEITIVGRTESALSILHRLARKRLLADDVRFLVAGHDDDANLERLGYLDRGRLRARADQEQLRLARRVESFAERGEVREVARFVERLCREALSAEALDAVVEWLPWAERLDLSTVRADDVARLTAQLVRARLEVRRVCDELENETEQPGEDAGERLELALDEALGPCVAALANLDEDMVRVLAKALERALLEVTATRARRVDRACESLADRLVAIRYVLATRTPAQDLAWLDQLSRAARQRFEALPSLDAPIRGNKALARLWAKLPGAPDGLRGPKAARNAAATYQQLAERTRELAGRDVLVRVRGTFARAV